MNSKNTLLRQRTQHCKKYAKTHTIDTIILGTKYIKHLSRSELPTKKNYGYTEINALNRVFGIFLDRRST
jgi:hypothetical protein